jgi:hypothetical protein
MCQTVAPASPDALATMIPHPTPKTDLAAARRNPESTPQMAGGSILVILSPKQGEADATISTMMKKTFRANPNAQIQMLHRDGAGQLTMTKNPAPGADQTVHMKRP